MIDDGNECVVVTKTSGFTVYFGVCSVSIW